jgi:hypothetical protein
MYSPIIRTTYDWYSVNCPVDDCENREDLKTLAFEELVPRALVVPWRMRSLSS